MRNAVFGSAEAPADDRNGGEADFLTPSAFVYRLGLMLVIVLGFALGANGLVLWLGR